MSQVKPSNGNLPRLWQHEALGMGLRRVLLRCLELAVLAAATDVHRARIALKRARAVLRLGEALGLAWAKPARRRLARHARRLAAARDWEVVATLARECVPTLRGDAQRCALHVARAALTSRPLRLAAWARWLAAERGRLARRRWPVLNRCKLRPALAKSVRRARRCSRLSDDRAGASELHDWRKAVIVLREQLYVLRPLVRSPWAHLAGQLREVARKLGAAGDWLMLMDAARGASRRTAREGGPGHLLAHAQAARSNALAQARGKWSALRPALHGKLV